MVAAAVLATALGRGSIPDGAMAAVALVTWWSVLAGFGLGLLPREASLPREAALALTALLVLTGLAALSVTWAPDQGEAFVEAVRYALYVGLFLLVVGGARRGEAPAVLAGLAIGLTAICALALGARLVPSILTGDQTRLAAFEASGGRLGYPIAYWNGLASGAAMTVPLLAWLGSAAGSPTRRAVAVAGIPAVVLVLYLTGSRGGVLALALALAVLLAFSAGRPRLLVGLTIGLAGGVVLVLLAAQSNPLLEGLGDADAKRAGALMLAATLALSAVVGYARLRLDRRLASLRVSRRLARAVATAIVAAAVIAGLTADIGGRLEALSEPVEARVGDGVAGRLLAPEGNGRRQLWETAIDGFLDNPLGGLGAGGFATYWNQNGSLPIPTRHAHSSFLEAFAELGALGGLAMLAFFGLGFAGAWTRTFGDLDGSVAAAAAVLGAATVAAATEWTDSIPAVFAAPLVAVALLTGPATMSQRDRSATAAARAGRLWAGQGARIAVSLAAAVAIAATGLLWLSERALDRSREWAAQDRYVEAAEAADRAGAVLPFAAAPRIQLGLVQESAGDLDGARDSLLEGIDRAPEDPVYLFLLARVDRFRGDPAWRDELERSLELAPWDVPPGTAPARE